MYLLVSSACVQWPAVTTVGRTPFPHSLPVP